MELQELHLSDVHLVSYDFHGNAHDRLQRNAAPDELAEL
jgi:hypothetical protein